MKRKRDASLGLEIPQKANGEVITFRLRGVYVKKLKKLSKRLKVGHSSMARLIIEKFLKDNDPDKER